ncbi:MAG: glycerophosphodiester phosphodiesterase [Verrucomicrobiota bacterium]|jgi:glycerophosphoryl diester phosphodiesterase|nr:glycerophosphodiester phosphodiesterase [Verrucomicrobiota bacterium]
MKATTAQIALGCVAAWITVDTAMAADVEIIAHRGASHDAPENTLESVQLGWHQGADAVEVDVYLSNDGHIIAHHDETTKKIAGVDRKVVDQTLVELQQLDVGLWKGTKWKGVRIPKLDDVLATIPEGRRMFVEVKCGPEIVPGLVKTFKRSGKKPEQLAVISFNYEVVKQAKARFPNIPCFYLSSFKRDKATGKLKPSADELIALAKAARLEGLNVSYKGLAGTAFIKKVQASGLELFTWTVNSPVEARRLAGLGINGITTDRPAWLREQMK